MTKRISYFEYGRVYPPLVADGQPVVPADATPDDPAPSPLRFWRVVALLWYVCHIAIIGAVFVTITVDAEGYCTSPLQPIVAIPAALLLWAITLTMRRLARREIA